jgi:hypothetical protein
MGILVEGIASLHGSVSMSVVQYLRFKMIFIFLVFFKSLCRKLIQQGKSHAFTFFNVALFNKFLALKFYNNYLDLLTHPVTHLQNNCC